LNKITKLSNLLNNSQDIIFLLEHKKQQMISLSLRLAKILALLQMLRVLLKHVRVIVMIVIAILTPLHQ